MCKAIVKFLNLLDVAEIALHRCVERTYQTDEHGSSEIAEISYSYEFLDDFTTPKPTLIAFLSDIFHCNPWKKRDKVAKDLLSNEIALESPPTVQNSEHNDDESAKDETVLESEDAYSWLQGKYNRKNHPLELMVSFK